MQTALAKTLYDNKAELPHELSFQKGELVTVLEQNPRGYDGWWICNIRGKVGIVPGNRLMLLGTVKPKIQSKSESSTSLQARPLLDLSGLDFMDGESPEPRSDIGSQSDKQTNFSISSNPNVSNNVSKDSGVDTLQYSSSLTKVNHSQINKGRGSLTVRFKEESPLANSPVPEKRSHSLTSSDNINKIQPRLVSSLSRDTIKSSPPSFHATSQGLPDYSLDSSFADSIDDQAALAEDQVALLSKKNGLQRIDSLHTSFTAAASQLFRFIRIDWKTRDCLQNTVKDLRLVCTTLRFITRRFVNYLRQIVHHIEQRNNHNLVKKLTQQMTPLRENEIRFEEALQKLGSIEWRADMIADLSLNPDTDYLSEVINAVRNISIQVRALATLVHGNSAMIFGTMVHSSSSENVMHSNLSLVASNATLLPLKLSQNSLSGSTLTSSATQLAKPRPPLPTSLVGASSSSLSSFTSSLPRPNELTKQPQLNGTSASPSSQNDTDLRTYRVQLQTQYQLFHSTVMEFVDIIQSHKPSDVLVTYSKFLLKCGTQMLALGTEACRQVPSRDNPWRRRVEEKIHATCDELKRMIHLTKICAMNRGHVLSASSCNSISSNSPTPVSSDQSASHDPTNATFFRETENLILCIQYVSHNFASLVHSFQNA